MIIEVEAGILGRLDQSSRWCWVKLSSAIEASDAKITEKVSTGLDDLITSFFHWRGWKPDCSK